jgi:hypothetical protein
MPFYNQYIRRCQHIKINGTQCGSPALRGHRLCFFHNRWRETRIPFNKQGSLHFFDSFDLPMLEDAESIQVAIMQVLRLVIAKHIDGKTAGLLLYGLQTASFNLKHTQLTPFEQDVVIDRRSVAHTALGSYAWYPEQFQPPPPAAEQPEADAEPYDQPKEPEESAEVRQQEAPQEVEAPQVPPARIAAAPLPHPLPPPILRAIPAPPGASKEMKNLSFLLQAMEKLGSMDKSG